MINPRAPAWDCGLHFTDLCFLMVYSSYTYILSIFDSYILLWWKYVKKKKRLRVMFFAFWTSGLLAVISRLRLWRYLRPILLGFFFVTMAGWCMCGSIVTLSSGFPAYSALFWSQFISMLYCMLLLLCYLLCSHVSIVFPKWLSICCICVLRDSNEGSKWRKGI